MFRKSIFPWYDTNAFNLILAVFLFCVFLFGVAGIRVSILHPAYHWYTWVPGGLAALSGGLLFAIGIRLANRRLGR